MNPGPQKRWSPSQELLAAFADGELDGCEDGVELRRRIENWLLLHPEGRAEADAIAELSRLVAATSPMEPDVSVWAKVLPSIERGCNFLCEVRSPRCEVRAKVLPRFESGCNTKIRRRFAALKLGAVVAACVAAAVVLVVMNRAPENQAPGQQEISGRQTNFAQGHGQLAVKDPLQSGATKVVPTVAPGSPREGFGAMAVLPVATNDEVEIIRVAGGNPHMLVVGRLPWSGPMVLVKTNEVQVKPPHDCMTCVGGGSTAILMMPLADDFADNK